MWRAEVDSWRRRLAGWLWSSSCLLCGQTDHSVHGDRTALAGSRGQPTGLEGSRSPSLLCQLDLCAGCLGDLPANTPSCEQCAGPLPPDVGSGRCAPCLLRPPPFTRCYAPLRYDFPVDRLIQALKYQHQLPMGRVLGTLLATHLLSVDAPCPQFILPVPLGSARYRSRGFNQARELALPVSAALGVPVRSDVLARSRETKEQAGLNRRQRLRNVRGAFTLTAPLQVRHVAVVDDVITTGSTVMAVSQLLRANGVQRVDVWAVARAVRR